ncbi:DUF423 domain-containing protein [Acinetobacter guerrae]|uniref:DUF423 domain-containing protein n=1 Tax=Acinetobacter guerrae TaxID=1843371 RepID=UPI00125EEDC9|nr:DUF423 domain-containing protein [Acinetobacter guerrae]
MWIAIAAVNLALAVILGAFGAHGLKAFATPEQIGWWGTATQYFFYHALGLLALGILSKVNQHFPIKASFILIQIGILLFCGSLYIMALGLPRGLGAITPLGGVFMILGWLVLAWNAIKYGK